MLQKDLARVGKRASKCEPVSIPASDADWTETNVLTGFELSEMSRGKSLGAAADLSLDECGARREALRIKLPNLQRCGHVHNSVERRSFPPVCRKRPAGVPWEFRAQWLKTAQTSFGFCSSVSGETVITTLSLFLNQQSGRRP